MFEGSFYPLGYVCDDIDESIAQFRGRGMTRDPRVPDWANFRARVDQQDLSVVMERDMGGDTLKFLYLDARAHLRHYLEYTWMSDAAWDQMRAM